MWIASAALALALAAGLAGAQGELPPATSIVGIAVEGGRAYVVDQRPFPGQLRVLSVADPARPRQLVARALDSCGLPQLAGGAAPSAVATDGAHAYVAVGERIDAVDVSDATAPREVGGAATPGLTAGRLRLADGRLYAAG